MIKKLSMLCLSFLFMLIIVNKAHAVGYGYNYREGGEIYNNVTMPLDVAKSVNEQTKDSTIVPVSDLKNSDIRLMKKGEAKRVNILGLVETGDAGIAAATKHGGIKTVKYVEYKKEKLYIPLIFIPIYYNIYTTTVYGE